MPNLSREKLWTGLKLREFAPVYVLFGEETYLRDKAARTIAELAFSDDDFRDFNDDHFTLNTPENLLSALSAAEQLPMMASRRVIRITDVRIAQSGAKDTLKEDYEAALKTYLEDPAPTSIVVFVGDELNGTRKLTKLLKAKAVAVEFTQLDEQGLRKWASDIFEREGIMIEAGSLRHLVELVGPGVRRLTTECEKLCTAAIREKRIDEQMIESLVRNTRELTNFEFAEHLAEGRSAEAIRSLEKILNDGAEPVALIGTLGWKFREKMRSAGASKYADRLARGVERIAETDLAIKTSVGGGGSAGSRMQIEMLVADLATY